MKKLLHLGLILSLLLPQWQAEAEEKGDSLRREEKSHLEKTRKHGVTIDTKVFHAFPLGAMVLASKGFDLPAYKMRQQYLPTFKTWADNAALLLPIGTTWGLYWGGIEPSFSNNGKEMVIAQVAAYGLNSALFLGTKYAVGRTRPDRSNNRSFPSGHTTLAFTGATILAQEYGSQYPWLASLGYTAATATALCRIANNKHWFSDLMGGAFIGIASTKVAYTLTALLLGKEYDPMAFYDEPLQGYKVGFGMGYSSIYGDKPSLPSPADGLARSLSVAVRVPLYKHWGFVASGSMIARNREDGTTLHGYSLFGSVSYFRQLPVWNGRLYAEGLIGIGQLSETRCTVASADRLKSREWSIPITAPGATLRPEAALLYRTGNHSLLKGYAAYLFSPTARDYNRSTLKGENGWELGLSLEWAW